MSKRNSPTVHIPLHPTHPPRRRRMEGQMTEQCPCGRPLDPTVFHDDDHQGRQLCERCCPTCMTTTTTKENTP